MRTFLVYFLISGNHGSLMANGLGRAVGSEWHQWLAWGQIHARTTPRRLATLVTPLVVLPLLRFEEKSMRRSTNLQRGVFSPSVSPCTMTPSKAISVSVACLRSAARGFQIDDRHGTPNGSCCEDGNRGPLAMSRRFRDHFTNSPCLATN